LSKDAKAMLASVQSKLKNSPTCSITLTAYPAASKAQQSIADKKLDAIKNYLVEKLGIGADRVSTEKSIGGGDQNTIDIKSN
jgi:ribosome assembly protein YihI (activator of Der GTPase)